MTQSIDSPGREAARKVVARAGNGYQIALVLGSGLGSLANEIEDAVRIPYSDLPGFPVSGVSSHGSEVVCGMLEGVKVMILSGRVHYYEKGDPSAMKVPLGMIRELGCERLLLTNAAGSLREEIAPGELMLINDHINWSGRSPLIGLETDDRFVGLTEAYDPEIRAGLKKAALEADIKLPEGVYTWFSGPNFETPAEIRAARIIGSDAVGMSTVPEVILARWLGLRVGAVSTITNYAAGMTGNELSHDETKEIGPIGAEKLKIVLRYYLRALAKGLN
ncbi:MAG: purine-nucleoside phosphorylase [Hyphomicrobiales bacterium]|nr:MAG: purine-nucleoside phosphorylase [Hyphomicrobiales bacterium]